MKDCLLRKVEDFRYVQWHQCGTLDDRLDFLSHQRKSDSSDLSVTHLEFSHNRGDLILESLIRNLPSSQIDLVADENDGNVDAFSPEKREPELGHAVKARGLRNRVDQTDDVRSSKLRQEMRT